MRITFASFVFECNFVLKRENCKFFIQKNVQSYCEYRANEANKFIWSKEQQTCVTRFFFPYCSFKIFVAFVIASVFGAPAPAPAAAPAPKPHYVSTVPLGYSAYASPYIGSPYVGSYVSPYSYAYSGYSPIGECFSIIIRANFWVIFTFCVNEMNFFVYLSSWRNRSIWTRSIWSLSICLLLNKFF